MQTKFQKTEQKLKLLNESSYNYNYNKYSRQSKNPWKKNQGL